MSSVGANTGIGQAAGSGTQTANPQQIGAQSLQITQPLQGSGAQSGVLGITDVLQSQNSTNQITVEGSDGSNSTRTTSQQIPESPTQNTNSFVLTPWLITVVVIGVCVIAFAFVWNQRKPSRY